PFNIVLLSETLIKNPLQIEEVQDNSLIVFDDIDTISNPELLDSLINFQAQLMEIGRHKNIKVFITSHLANGIKMKQGRIIMNEMQSFTFFPGSGSFHQIKHCLTKYFG